MPLGFPIQKHALVTWLARVKRKLKKNPKEMGSNELGVFNTV